MSSNAEKLYQLIANDSKKKQSLFMTALTNPKKACLLYTSDAADE